MNESGVGIDTRLKTATGPVVLRRLLGEKGYANIDHMSAERIVLDDPILLFDADNKETELTEIQIFRGVDCKLLTLASAATVTVGMRTGLMMGNGLWARAGKAMKMDSVLSYTCGCGAKGGLAITEVAAGVADIYVLNVPSFQLANGAILRSLHQAVEVMYDIAENIQDSPASIAQVVDDNFNDLLED